MKAAARPPASAGRKHQATAWLLAAGLGLLAGCAGLPDRAGLAGTGQPFRDPGLSMQAASEAVVIGKSSQQEVMAALGPPSF